MLGQLLPSINEKALIRLLKNLGCDFNELQNKCTTSDDLCVVVSMVLSKQSSRQGVLDELLVLKSINKYTSQFNVFIKKPKKNIKNCKRYYYWNKQKNICI